jgi:hypothetical protein
MTDLYQKTDSPGLFYPQDFFIASILFAGASGKVIELKEIMVELSYFEDIYSSSISGYLYLHDAGGYEEILQITGNESITIVFGKTKDNTFDPRQMTFRVYKTDARVPLPNMTSEGYSIQFCSEEFLISEQYKVSKGFKATKISDIIKNILTEELLVSEKSIQTIEETKGLYDFIIPNIKPFEAINWLSVYAQSMKNLGSDMLFFDTYQGYNFRSLQSMFKDDVYGTFKYQLKNFDDRRNPFADKMGTILQYEFMKTFDALDAIKSGLFANQLVSINPIIRDYKVTNFDYSKYLQSSNSLNKNGILSKSKNQFGDTQNQTYQAVLKVAASNFGYNTNEYIKNKPGSVENSIDLETYVPNRTAQISLINHTRLKISIPGDPFISVGRTIDIIIPNFTPVNNIEQPRDRNKFYSGKYLVTAVRHIIQAQGINQSILEISKDSTSAELTDSINTNSNASDIYNQMRLA